MHFHLGAWSQRVEYCIGHWFGGFGDTAFTGSDSLDLRPYILLAYAIRHTGHPFRRIHALAWIALLHACP